MQTSVESTGVLERRVTFNIPVAQVADAVDGKLREIARTARIKGFRPGRIPQKVVEQRYGEQVRAEVVDGLLREGFEEAIRTHEFRLAGNPRIEPAAAGDADSLGFVATFELVPDFGDIDVGTLEVTRHRATVEEADIDRMIESLRQQRRSFSPTAEAAKAGDLATIATWSLVDGERVPAEGSEPGRTVIGSHALLPEIEAALEGMRVGEEKTVAVQFPEQMRDTALAGRSAQAHITLTELAVPELPEVDAEFIRSFGVKSGDPVQFRSDIRTNLERELKGALMGRLRRNVGDSLIAAYSHVELPARVVEDEARSMLAQSIEQARRMGREIGQVPADAHTPFMDAARKRVLVGLLVGEIARRNALRLEAARVNESLRLIASTYEDPQQVLDLYRNDPQLMEGLQHRVMEEQVIDWIAERARHTDETIDFQQAISPQA